MIKNFGSGEIIKGSDVQLTVYFGLCCADIDMEQASSITVDFYTTPAGAAIEKNEGDIVLDEENPQIGYVVLQAGELDTLDDGVISYTAKVDGFIKEVQTQYYLKTPIDYVPTEFVDYEEVEQMIEDALSGFTPEIPIASSAQTGVVKIGSGITVDADGTISAQGGGSSATKYVLNLMTQQERAALYTELMAYRDVDTYVGISSGFPAEQYNFYAWANDDAIRIVVPEFQDRYNGFIPMGLAVLHPDDYGGAAFFTGVVGNRLGDGGICKININLTSDGSIDIRKKLLFIPGVVPYGFSFPDNGLPAYDVANQKFGFTNFPNQLGNPDTWLRDIDITSATVSIVRSSWVENFYANGSFFADASRAYATPCFKFCIWNGSSGDVYSYPSIYIEPIPQITVDGRTFERKAYFTYTKKDGSRFMISMLLNDSGYGTQFTYTAL